MNHFSSVEGFLEKTAAALPMPSHGTDLLRGKTSLGPLATEISSLGQYFKKMGPLGKTLTGLGAAGILGAGAVGIGGLLSGERTGATMSYRLNKGLNTLMDRIRADEQVGESFAKGVGSGAAESLMGLTRDIVSKGYETMKDTLTLSPVRKKIFKTLREEDDIINMADNRTLMEAYHTMANVAPHLSTDKNAVKSVLRMAATSGGGLDYTTIKGIADAETAVAKAKREGGV